MIPIRAAVTPSPCLSTALWTFETSSLELDIDFTLGNNELEHKRETTRVPSFLSAKRPSRRISRPAEPGRVIFSVPPMKIPKILVDGWHVFWLVACVFGGGVYTYFMTVPTENLLKALSSWSTASPILWSALGAGAAAVVLMGKQSYFRRPLIPPASSTPPVAGDRPSSSSPSRKPPLAVMGDARMRFARAGLAVWLCALSLAVVALGCIPSPAQQEADGQALYGCVQANWGKPFLTVVATCAKDAPAVVADIIADVEAVIEAVGASSDGGTATAAAYFPYADVPEVQQALPAARARHARHDAGSP